MRDISSDISSDIYQGLFRSCVGPISIYKHEAKARNISYRGSNLSSKPWTPFTIHIFLSSCPIHLVEVTYSFCCSPFLKTTHVSITLYRNNCLRRAFAAYILLDITERAFRRVLSSFSSRTTCFWLANCTDLWPIACAKLFIFRPARYLSFTPLIWRGSSMYQFCQQCGNQVGAL